MKKGILITAKVGDKVNPMTIGWGTLGIEWGRPIFVAYVRVGRYTRKMLDESGEFTINIPYGDVDSKILTFCGRTSGRDTDKVAEMNLDLVESDIVKVPGIRQFALTLECKVLCHQLQNTPELPEAIFRRYYPQDVDSTATGNNEDFHIAYYGEIVNAYLITD